MTKKIIVSFVLILFTFNFDLVSAKIFIKAKVNNQIITNIDVKNEKNYLIALNPNLRNLSEININRYAIDSLINEKIKQIEIEKKFKILQNEKIIKKIISDLYSKIGISDLETFKEYLNNYGINLELVKNKISIEVAWNDYIVSKFNNVVLVDEAKIRKKIDQLSEKNSVENILLSEIIFTIKENENLEKKFSIIKNSINNIGFDETAKIYSVSESKQNGGKIGWVYKSQLSSKIANHLSKINIGEFTKPITTPGGFIVLKIIDKKEQFLEIDKNEQFKKAVNFEKNRQLTMYSTLHYKRVYNKAVINEF
tara:strand:- start:2269 stop:3198 length:930 start_codon:yes stop_codon:yes gene_type:complete